jgi:putative GTP pyrophosphokinase
MADHSPHERLGASRRSVDRAGDLLRDWHRSGALLLDPDQQDADQLIERYRHEYEIPLTKVVMGVRSFLATGGLPVLVGQRLKRRPRIIEKLARHPTMRLTSMQDIGGCRALIPDFEAVDRIVDRVRQTRWDVARIDDYNRTPKPTGYRAVHLIIRRDLTPIEIQLRTPWQQDWARAVERLDARYGLALKDGSGPEVLLRYLERFAYALDRSHSNQPVEPPLIRELEQLGQEAQRWLSQQSPRL